MVKKFTLLCSFLCSLLLGAQAQTSILTPDTTVCANTPITLRAQKIGRNAQQANITQDDYYAPGVFSIGFPFTFYGTAYSRCAISSNGFICFDTTKAGASSPYSMSSTSTVPGNSSVRNAAMGFYSDILPTVNGNTSGTIDYAVVGTAPNRKFVVTFCKVPMYSCNTLLASFQMILNEGTNTFDVHIDSVPICRGWNGGYAIEGVQNAAGTAATVVPGRQPPATWTAYHSSHRFTPSGTGTSYTVAPIVYDPIPNGSAVVKWYENGTTLVGTGDNVNVTPNLPTFYVAQVSDCGFTSYDTVRVSISGPAPPTPTPPNFTYCQFDNAVALSASGSNLKWYSAATGGTGSVTPPVPATNVPGTVTYYVSQYPTGAGCESPRASISVLVNGQPGQPSVAPSIQYCIGATPSPLNSYGNDIRWYTSATGGVGTTTAPTPSTAVAGDSNFYSTQTINGCQSERALTVVHVNPTPDTPTGVTQLSYCQNSTATPLSVNGSNIKWYAGPTGGNGTTTAPTPSTATPGTTYYYVSQALGICEGPRKRIEVTVKPKPVAPTAPQANYCLNSTAVPLTASGANLLWYTVPTGGTGSATAPTPSTSNPGTTYYYATQAVDGCTSDRGQAVVQVGPQLSPPLTTDVSYCQFDASQPLSATGQNLAWYTSSTGGAGSSVSPVPGTSDTGNTTYYVTQSTGCESPRQPLSVYVKPTPGAPAVSSPVIYCEGQNAIPLTSSGTSPYWSMDPTGANSNQQPPVPSTSTSGVTSYYVYSIENGCRSQISTLNVVINPKPASPSVSSVTYCIGAQAAPLSATGSNLKWYSAPSGGSGTPVTPTPSTSTPDTTNYYVSQTINGCESNRSRLPVIVSPQPAAPTASPDTLSSCQYQPIPSTSFNATNPLLWYTAPTGGVGSSSPRRPDSSVAASTTYYISQVIAGCESERAPLYYTINPRPDTPTTFPVTVCQDDTAEIRLTANGASLMWYNSLTATNGQTQAPHFFPTAYDTTSYYVTQTLNGCSSRRAQLLVRVKRRPDAVPAVSDIVRCQYDTLGVLSANGQNLLWYPASTGGTGDPTAPVPGTFRSGSSSYYVTQTVAGCESDRRQIVTRILDKPAPPQVTSPLVVCQGQTPDPAPQATGRALKWYAAAYGGSGDTATPHIHTSYQQTQEYWVSQTSSNGCESDRIRILASVRTRPNGTIISLADSICQGSVDTLHYFGNADADMSVTWKVVGGATLLNRIGRDTIVVRADSVGAVRVRMQSDNKGCSAKEVVIDVPVQSVPQLRLTGPETGCTGVPLQVGLNRTEENISGYEWNFDGATIAYGAFDQGPFGLSWNQEGKYVVAVRPVRKGCKGSWSGDTIRVYQTPEARIASVSSTDVCALDSVEYIAAAVSGTGKYHYRWIPERLFGGVDADRVWGRAPEQSGPVSLEVTSENGCHAIDSVKMTVRGCCEVYTPTAFSPNNDGLNDRFAVKGGQSMSQPAQIRIQNRWGQTVYESNDLTQGWDGTLNGRPVDMGTYFFYLQYRCSGKTVEQKGEITLIR